MQDTCILIRHPTRREGQTALALNYLRALRLVYNNNIKIIDTTKLGIISTSKYGLYLTEALITAPTNCNEIHLLNVNKVIPALMNKLVGHKKVFSYQFSYLPKIHSNWRIKRTIIESGSNIVIGSSRRIAGLFRNGVFIKPPIDIELFKPRDKVLVRKILGLPVNRRIIGYIGDVDEMRGFDIVAKLANTTISNLLFLIVSLHVDNISRDATLNLARAVRNGSALLIFKKVPIWYVYNSVNALLLPIRGDYPTEPPMTLLEALASGTPVIASLSQSMLDYKDLYISVKDDEWGDVKSIISNEELLKEYGERAREYMVKNHNYKAIASELEKLL